MDPFATLGVDRRFDLDLAAVEKQHRELSRALHPDKFAQSGAGERRDALDRAATANEAWRIVRDPIKRAEALFTLAGIAVGDTNEPKASPDFLMDMLDEREALAEAKAEKNLEKVSALGVAMSAKMKATEAALSAGFAANQPDVLLLGQLRFYRRFLDEVSAIEDEAMS